MEASLSVITAKVFEEFLGIDSIQLEERVWCRERSSGGINIWSHIWFCPDLELFTLGGVLREYF